MKNTNTTQPSERATETRTFATACLECCEKVLAQIASAKRAIFAEAREKLTGQEQMLHHALNEAEALARETLFPGLFFPTLAVEKVRHVAAWNHRQRALSLRAR